MRLILAVCLALACSRAVASIVVVRSERDTLATVSLFGGSNTDVDESSALNPVDWLDLSAHATNSDGLSSGEASATLHSEFSGSTFSFDGDVAFSASGPTSSGGIAFSQASFVFAVTGSPVTFTANLLNAGDGGVLRLGYENGAEILEAFTGYNDSLSLSPGLYYIQSLARAANGIDQSFDFSFSFDSDVTFDDTVSVVPELSSIATWSVIALGCCLTVGQRRCRRFPYFG